MLLHVTTHKISITTHVDGDLSVRSYVWRFRATLRFTFTPSYTPAANNAFVVLNLCVTQVSIGCTGVCEATVLQDVVKVGVPTGFFGGERLHGGENQGQTVCHVFVRRTG